jgi:hypothetical protein
MEKRDEREGTEGAGMDAAFAGGERGGDGREPSAFGADKEWESEIGQVASDREQFLQSVSRVGMGRRESGLEKDAFRQVQLMFLER